MNVQCNMLDDQREYQEMSGGGGVWRKRDRERWFLLKIVYTKMKVPHSFELGSWEEKANSEQGLREQMTWSPREEDEGDEDEEVKELPKNSSKDPLSSLRILSEHHF